MGYDAVMSPWLEKLFIELQYYFPNMKMENLNDKFIPKWKVSLLKEEENLSKNCVTKDIYFSKGQQNDYITANAFQVKQNFRTTEENHFQVFIFLLYKKK